MFNEEIRCEQCSTVQQFEAATTEQLNQLRTAAGWAIYGTGVTPLAKEFNAGRYQCGRCGDETAEQRAKRLTNEVFQDAGVGALWATSYVGEEVAHVTIWTSPEPAKFDFDVQRTDEDTRREIREQLTRVWHPDTAC